MRFFYMKPRIPLIAELVKQLNVKEVLDLGGGIKVEGDLKKELRKLGCECKYKSVDLVNADVIFDLNKRFHFRKTDCIVAASVMEYLNSPKQFLADCYSSLQKGGYLIVVVPNAVFWKFRLHALGGKVPMGFPIPTKPGAEKWIFTWEILEKMVRAAGFKIVRRVRQMKIPLPRNFERAAFLVCRK